jgi:hypothetical protein
MSEPQCFICRLLAPLARRLGVPTLDEFHSVCSDWDYDQSNMSKLWDAEKDPDALSEAMRMRQTDLPGALAALRQLADGGSPIAMIELGETYLWGQGVEPDESQGEAWLKKAYLAGAQRALLTYGHLLRSRGETSEAESVFRTGAEDGWSPAIYWLGRMRRDSAHDRATLEEARLLLEQAAAMGNPSARWSLAKDMAKGRFGWRHLLRGRYETFALGRYFASEFDKRRAEADSPSAPPRKVGQYWRILSRMPSIVGWISVVVSLMLVSNSLARGPLSFRIAWLIIGTGLGAFGLQQVYARRTVRRT